MAELADAQDLKSCGGDIVPVRSRSPAVRDFSLDYFVDKCIILVIDYVCVAQLDRALGYGPRCRGFESSHARLENPQTGSFLPVDFLQLGGNKVE